MLPWSMLQLLNGKRLLKHRHGNGCPSSSSSCSSVSGDACAGVLLTLRRCVPNRSLPARCAGLTWCPPALPAAQRVVFEDPNFQQVGC